MNPGPRRPALTGPPGKRDSLAGRLTRTLIVWVGGVWLVCVLGVVWYVNREIKNNSDHELIEVSHRMFDTALNELDKLEAATPNAPAPLIARPQLFSSDAVLYQVVDPDGRTLLVSAEASGITFNTPPAPGFRNVGAWRIFTVRHPVRSLYFQVADPIEERRTAINRTLLGLIIPLVAVLPLLALVLRKVARSQLWGLQELANEIEQRSGADLRPIRLPGLPGELRSVSDNVNRLLERLSHSLDVERALAANAAHELRTPLTAVRLRLQTALEHKDLMREEVLAALDALQTLGHRTEKLLQLSRAESGASLTRERVDLAHLAGTVAQEFWEDTRVGERLSLKVPDSEPPIALGDIDSLAIALRNLVENALRYGAPSRVVIEVIPPTTLCVRDFGPGVDAEQLRTLLQRHVRHGSNRAGYGLGLSIVSTIVEKLGGRIELASPPPSASTGFEARIVLRPA
jgi:two-component system OmpR family sensor kinase